MSYLIYQRVLSDNQVKAVNKNQDSSLAKAYFGLCFPTEAIAQARVNAALSVGLYKRTMIISATDGMSISLEHIFEAGNGYPAGNINVISICSHPSMSVGDIAINLLGDDMFLCMPTGWHKLKDLALDLYEKG